MSAPFEAQMEKEQCEQLSNGKCEQVWPPRSSRDLPDKTCAAPQRLFIRAKWRAWPHSRSCGVNGPPPAGQRCTQAMMRGGGSCEPSQMDLEECIIRALRRGRKHSANRVASAR